VLVEGEDYYINENGFVVLTAKFLLKRGFCCGSGCTNCPYDYEAVPEPKRSSLLLQKKKRSYLDSDDAQQQ
jgi:hypothetical protein